MTVCIGILCERGDKVIVASDRMWTEKYLSIEFEHEGSKIVEISESSVATTAGSVVVPTELLENVKREVKDKDLREVSEIAKVAKKYFIEERNKRVSDEYFEPRALTLKDFYHSGVQSHLHPTIVQRLDSMVEDYKFELEIMVGGVDNKGGHLYVVFSPGRLEPFDRVGYLSIGSGSPHVESTFILNGFSQNWKLGKALYIVYEGKRLAEKAPGVGKKTDIAIIDRDNGITLVPESTIKYLSKIFDEKTKTKGLEDPDVSKMIEELSIEEEEK